MGIEPKLWKDYKSDIGVEFSATSTTEYTVSDFDYRGTVQLKCFEEESDDDNDEDNDATMELLKITSKLSPIKADANLLEDLEQEMMESKTNRSEEAQMVK